MWNYFEFGPLVQEEMLFIDISYLQLWQPSCLVARNHEGNCGRGHYEDLFCEIILIWTSGSGDVVLRYFVPRALVAILFSTAE